MRPVLCVGALALDTIFQLERLPRGPGKVLPLAALEVAEGMAAAQAATIVRLGGAAALWAAIGDDATGRRLVAELEAAGVDCSRVRRVAGARSGFSTILMDREGGTIIVPHYDPRLGGGSAEAPELADIGAVMVDVRWPGAAAAALHAARERGIPGILDADVAAKEVLEGLVPLASHVIASEDAARLLTGSAGAEGAARHLMNLHQGFIAVTAGADGCWWSDGGTLRRQRGFTIAAVDTLAAGDVFHAAFALMLVEQKPMAEIIRFAAAAAALKCTRFGGRLGAPDRAEVERFLERAG